MNLRLLALAIPAALLASVAIGSTPSPMWRGVERVVIACSFDDSIGSSLLRTEICNQVSNKAARLTSYPVSVATDALLDRRAGDLREQSRSLILRVEASLGDQSDSSSKLIVSFRAERLGFNDWQGAPMPPCRAQIEQNDAVAETSECAALLAGIFNINGPAAISRAVNASKINNIK